MNAACSTVIGWQTARVSQHKINRLCNKYSAEETLSVNINQYLVSWTTALIRGELDCTALIPGELGLLRSYLVSWTVLRSYLVSWDYCAHTWWVGLRSVMMTFPDKRHTATRLGYTSAPSCLPTLPIRNKKSPSLSNTCNQKQFNHHNVFHFRHKNNQ